MERINIDKIEYHFNENDKNKVIDDLKNDQLMVNFCEKNDIPIEQMLKAPFKFQKIRNSLRKCIDCKGLFMCKQDIEGQYLSILDNQLLRLEYKMCKYKQANELSHQHLKNYWISYLSPKQELVTPKNINIDNMSNSYIKVAFELSKLYQENNTKLLYIYGNTGVGKSYLCSAYTNLEAIKGNSVCFCNVPAWIVKLKNCLNDPIELEKQFEMMKLAKLVVFDDIGTETNTPWIRDDVLFPILNYRMEHQKQTLFTSNLSFKELLEHYSYTSATGLETIKGIRIMERIKALASEIEIKGDNLRNT